MNFKSITTLRNMNRDHARNPAHKFVDVYVTPECPSCARVIALLQSARGLLGYELRVITLTRNADTQIQPVVNIYPATYINGRLAFYGDFDIEDLRSHLADRSIH